MSGRLGDWEERLFGFLSDQRGEKFQYGIRDCVLYAATWIELATGSDPAQGIRATYVGPIGARRALAALGVSSVSEAVTLFLGEPQSSALEAQRGDIAAIADQTGFSDVALGVVAGRDVFFLGEYSGLVVKPLSQVELVWKV